MDNMVQSSRSMGRVIRSVRTNEGSEFMVNRVMPQDAMRNSAPALP